MTHSRVKSWVGALGLAFGVWAFGAWSQVEVNRRRVLEGAASPVVTHLAATEAGALETTDEEMSPDDKVVKSDAEWRKQLTDKEFRVTRRHATERAFSGKWWDNKKSGTYYCVCCQLPLFGSEHKFDSGTGWPSFYQPVKPTHVGTQDDVSLFTRRT